jgi:uncharacterized Zn-binding protein involved in type VI secretion
MPPVARVDDVCTGHGPFPSRKVIQGSGNVFANGLPVHRELDKLATHCKPPPITCHGGVLALGLGSVLVNGRPIARRGDPVSCGGEIATGSPNVFAG